MFIDIKGNIFCFPVIPSIFCHRLSQRNIPAKISGWVIGGKAGGGVDLYAGNIGRHMGKYMPNGVVNKLDFIT
jgi:tripartite-type tricarboxylate transporter receptor subunit TctC